MTGLPRGTKLPVMNTRSRAALLAAALLPALLAVKARTAATSISRPVASFAAAYGGRVPIPAQFHAASRRALDEAGSPESVLLYAAGGDEQAWPRAARLQDAGVLVQALPLEDARAAQARAKKLKPVPGLAYPAFAHAASGRVSVYLFTPKRLVRVSAARWTSAFDAVVRGYRDAP